MTQRRGFRGRTHTHTQRDIESFLNKPLLLLMTRKTTAVPPAVPAPQAAQRPLYDALWEEIEGSLSEVNGAMQGKPPAAKSIHTKIEWYEKVYNAVILEPSGPLRLFERLKSWIAQDLETRVVSSVLEMAQTGDGEALYILVARIYQGFLVAKKYACFLFTYIDEWVKLRPSCDSIDRVYLKAFHKCVYVKVRDSVRSVILWNITRWREGENVSMLDLKASVNMFIQVGTSLCNGSAEQEEVYVKEFETFYLEQAVTYFELLVALHLSRDDGPRTYVEWADVQHTGELLLAKSLLRPSSIVAVTKMLNHQLLDEAARGVIVHSTAGIKALLEDNEHQKLKYMYDLFCAVPETVATMAAEIRADVEEKGRHIFSAYSSYESGSEVPLARERMLIESCLELHQKYNRIVNTYMGSDRVIHDEVVKAFETFLNVPIMTNNGQVTTAEVLATYINAVMKRELKDIVDPQAELDRIDQLATLFTYLKEKDVFQEYHKAKLAKRLLQTTPNEELEKAFIEKLQRVMGNGFTHKMEGMLHDRENTRAMSDAFHSDPLSQGLPADVTFQVLAAGHWPAYRSDALVPTAALRQSIDAFTRFYKRSHATRTLSWIHMLGSATLSIAFPKGVKDVTCSIPQATILVLIDEAGKMSLRSLADAMRLDAGVSVKPLVQSMCTSRNFNVLVCCDKDADPTGRPFDAASDDAFSLNYAFQHRVRKFRLPSPSSVATGGSGDAGNAPPPDEKVVNIEQLRKLEIDACIVRVMKARRVLNFTDLSHVVADQLAKRFPAQARQVKLQVEDLVLRGYLSRDDADVSVFHYVS